MPPGGAQSTSREDGPCAGLKKHGGRLAGNGCLAIRAFTQATAYRPSSRISVTCRISSGLVTASSDILASS